MSFPSSKPLTGFPGASNWILNSSVWHYSPTSLIPTSSRRFYLAPYAHCPCLCQAVATQLPGTVARFRKCKQRIPSYMWMLDKQQVTSLNTYVPCHRLHTHLCNRRHLYSKKFVVDLKFLCNWESRFSSDTPISWAHQTFLSLPTCPAPILCWTLISRCTIRSSVLWGQLNLIPPWSLLKSGPPPLVPTMYITSLVNTSH